MLDTAAVAERAFDLFIGPRCRDELRTAFHPLGQVDSWIATLCGLHDLGKYAPTFQGLQADLAVSRFGEVAAADIRRVRKREGIGRRIDTPHGVLTAVQLKELLLSWGAPAQSADWLAVALGGHHGHFPAASALQQARLEVNNHGRATWQGWRGDFVRQIAQLRGLPDPSTLPWSDVHVSVPAAVGLAALATISDWIASDTGNFPFADTTDLRHYAGTLAELADNAVDRLDLRAWTPPRQFAELFPDRPRPVQTVVERMTVDRDEPTLVVIEAPTGEGKTKAALQAAAALVRNLGLVGTYVAMPTQATGNQLFDELEALVKGHDAGVSVSLIHSNAKEHLDKRATTPTDIGRDDEDDSDLQAQEWFTRKKSLLATIGVGTVDQALKAVLRSGHGFVRLTALTNKVLVVDEVDAYATYMSTLLDRLLNWLGRLGVSVVLLTATLPAARRQDLVAAWQSGLLGCLPREVPRLEASADYPRVTVAGTGRPAVEPAGLSDLNSGRRLVLARVTDDGIADWALDRVADGGCAVVMHNLRGRVTATHDTLADRIALLPTRQRPRLIMIHGKLTASDRRKAEEELRTSFGPGGTRPRAIVIGTQVLEGGLDLDFDAMLTDLAPVDRLIQRAGRLHRHAVRGTPVLAIAGVTDTDAGPEFPRYLDKVYAPMTVLRTWALLRDRKSLELPGEVPTLVDALYGPPEAVACPPGWETAWQAADEKLTRSREASGREARLMYLPAPLAVSRLDELTRNSKDSSRTREKYSTA